MLSHSTKNNNKKKRKDERTRRKTPQEGLIKIVVVSIDTQSSAERKREATKRGREKERESKQRRNERSADAHTSLEDRHVSRGPLLLLTQAMHVYT